MDETYIKVKGEWRYLYRAVDKQGQTIDFLLTEHRDTEAALRFLKKAIRRHGVPEKITIDGSDANEAAIKSYNEAHGTTIIIRQVKYLNNIVEQDHRALKRVTRPMLGFNPTATLGCVAQNCPHRITILLSPATRETAFDGLIKPCDRGVCSRSVAVGLNRSTQLKTRWSESNSCT